MKNSVSLLVTSACCLTWMLSARAENVVKNSSFEVGMDSYAIQRAEYLKKMR